MRMIQITDECGEQRLINPSQITQIWKDDHGVWIALSCGHDHGIRTQFTTIDHALDYIQRASSHSLVGG